VPHRHGASANFFASFPKADGRFAAAVRYHHSYIMNIGILISGRGSNMAAIADAVADRSIPASEVAVVIIDKRDAAGLAKAAERGIETLVIERGGRTRTEHDAEIAAELRKRNVE